MTEQQVKDILGAYVGPSVTTAIFQQAARIARIDTRRMDRGGQLRLLQALEYPLKSLLRDPQRRDACLRRLRDLLAGTAAAQSSTPRDRKIRILSETDIVVARGAGRDLCQHIGFRAVVQLKVATAISELARNIIQYAGKGTVELISMNGKASGIEVTARDNGPGISELEAILGGQYRSKTGMGLGIRGVKNLMDEFEIETVPDVGTRIVARKFLS